MKYLIALAICCAAAEAKPVAEAQGEAGYLTVHDEVGECQGTAKRATWTPNGGVQAIEGCWRAIEGGLQIAFRDGDALRIPLGAFRPVRAL